MTEWFIVKWFFAFSPIAVVLVLMIFFNWSGSRAGAARLLGLKPTTLEANPFALWFGIDEATVRQVLAEATARGADFADLFFQGNNT